MKAMATTRRMSSATVTVSGSLSLRTFVKRYWSVVLRIVTPVMLRVQGTRIRRKALFLNVEKYPFAMLTKPSFGLSMTLSVSLTVNTVMSVVIAITAPKISPSAA